MFGESVLNDAVSSFCEGISDSFYVYIRMKNVITYQVFLFLMLLLADGDISVQVC